MRAHSLSKVDIMNVNYKNINNRKMRSQLGMALLIRGLFNLYGLVGNGIHI